MAVCICFLWVPLLPPSVLHIPMPSHSPPALFSNPTTAKKKKEKHINIFNRKYDYANGIRREEENGGNSQVGLRRSYF